MTNTVALTQKQIAVMTVVCEGNEGGSFVDLDQIIERLPYKTSKPALTLSLKILVKRGLVILKPTEYRRKARRRVIAPDPKVEGMF